MGIPTNEWLAVGILLLAAAKLAWDFFFSGEIHARDETEALASAKSTTEEIHAKRDAAKRKKRRDKNVAQLTAYGTIVMSVWLIAIAITTREVTAKDFAAAEEWMAEFDARLTSLEARLPPQ
ncbi:MAG: hypothetical protein ABNH26_13115 [Celeribacter sp.]|jgi:hypothetical protein